jgi:hypothetical protein
VAWTGVDWRGQDWTGTQESKKLRFTGHRSGQAEVSESVAGVVLLHSDTGVSRNPREGGVSGSVRSATPSRHYQATNAGVKRDRCTNVSAARYIHRAVLHHFHVPRHRI